MHGEQYPRVIREVSEDVDAELRQTIIQHLKVMQHVESLHLFLMISKFSSAGPANVGTLSMNPTYVGVKRAINVWSSG